MPLRQELLSQLPSVDELLKSEHGRIWLEGFPRPYVLRAIRETIDLWRKEILAGTIKEIIIEEMVPEIGIRIERLSSPSLRPLINATGVVIHTNLGRAVLSRRVTENIVKIATSYSNLEYDLSEGRRGKRYSHVKRLLRDITGAEDGFVVNNNAAAVFLCLNTLARGREVIVSRGELIEIGGSFRIPDVMANSGAILVEVGTTNKTHLYDYERAINENTALILKVHQSNYRIQGFTEDVSIEELVRLGHGRGIPVMHDLGSGCLIDLKPFGIHSEPSVKNILKSGVDLVTFSGDKLLGGPQAGLIIGKKEIIENIQKNPLTRAVRIDKLTLSALEMTLFEYLDEERAIKDIPTLRMLFEDPSKIKERAKKIYNMLKRGLKDAEIELIQDISRAGGGSLPEVDFPTHAVSIKPVSIPIKIFEERLRNGNPAVIIRVKDDRAIIDARTVQQREIPLLVSSIKAALT
jgi:L-seryl-tRNA(Ser) seleniumtransferase